MIWYALATIAVVLGLYLAWRLVKARYLSFPPLAIDENDPLMLEAYEKAHASVDRFRLLFGQRPHACTVKIPFRTDRDVIEHLWGEVRGLNGDFVRLVLVNRPVMHDGSLPNEVEVPLGQITDWQVLNPDDTISGGFSTRVMFIRAKEQSGELPPHLAEQQKRFIDWPTIENSDTTALSGES